MTSLWGNTLTVLVFGPNLGSMVDGLLVPNNQKWLSMILNGASIIQRNPLSTAAQCTTWHLRRALRAAQEEGSIMTSVSYMHHKTRLEAQQHPYLELFQWLGNLAISLVRGALLDQICSFFEHCSKSLWPPPPCFEHYVAIFFDGFLKKRVNVCCDKIWQNNA